MLLAQALAASEEEAVKASRRRVRCDWTHTLGPTLHLYNTGRGRGPTLHLYTTGRGRGLLYNVQHWKGGGGLLYICIHWKGEGAYSTLYNT